MNVNNMNNMLKQAKKMQEEFLKCEQEFSKKEFLGTSGGGAVNLKLNGKKELLSINISKDVVDPSDVEMLQDLILAAYNDAFLKAEESLAKDMGKFNSIFKLPGLF